MLAKRIEGALRESTKIRVGEPLPQKPERKTVPPPHPTLANVRTEDGRFLSDVPFAKLVEFTVTGELGPLDEVSMGGRPFQRLETIHELARHLPPSTATTNRLEGPGVPDYAAELATTNMLEVLSWLLFRRETGAVFADRPTDPSRSTPPPPSTGSPSRIFGSTRKEIYLERGRVVLVASSEPSELLGEYLVRRGAIERSELEIALSALPRYDGRLGDTLIGLGFVDPVEIFRAIQSQGRARVAALFRWTTGRVSFYRDVRPQRVDFRLDLELPDLMLAGLEESAPDSDVIARHHDHLDITFMPVRPAPAHATSVVWPPSVLLLLSALGPGRQLAEVVVMLREVRKMQAAETLRALEVAIAGGLVQRAH
jgi:serine/threonine-protein kinase